MYKVASADVTNHQLLHRIARTGKPIIMSTGMSTMDEIRHAVTLVPPERLLLMHSTSTYPCPADEINLRMLGTLAREFDVPVGYSGHEVGLQISLAAVTMGACALERHITLDRAMWGSDQAASVEPPGLQRLVRDIRVVELARGDGVKQVYDSELPVRKKLRRK
jgi:N-acetylneuraminate synthase